MARQARTVIPGQVMHVMVRGNNRETLFFSEDDRRIYLQWLRGAAKQFGCAVHAFALMPNHVHLLLTPQDEDCSLWVDVTPSISINNTSGRGQFGRGAIALP